MDKIQLIGLIAAILTTSSFIPQALKVIKTKETKDISLSMYSLLVVGIVLWLIYGLLTNDLPLIIANGVTLFFSVIILIMKIKYK